MEKKSVLKGQFTPYAEMTPEQRHEFHVLGGKAVQKKKKDHKQLQQYLRAILDSETASGDVAGDMCWALIEKALAGDVKAFETIRSTIGEDNPTKLEVDNNIIQVTLDDD